MPSDRQFALTRRAFATGMTGSLMPIGNAAVAAARGDAPDDADLRDAALRGLARAADLGDPVLAGKADAVLAHMADSDPEGALLVRIYRAFDVASAACRYGRARTGQAGSPVLTALHAAVCDCRAVSFDYTDLAGAVTTRTVLPLALVHPPQGIKLLAWCEKRRDHRQFFVSGLRDLTVRETGFRDRRLLLQQLADSTDVRAFADS